MVSAGMKSG